MHGSNQNSGAAVAPATDSKALESCKDAEQFCVELSRLFGVRRHEVALLHLENGLLTFLFPRELKSAGSIPISSATAIAAHTAITKKVELFNSFTKVKHASIFESVKLGATEDTEAGETAPIQKLMSAPVLTRENRVLGVLQVCRKGMDPQLAGDDFTQDDLQRLESAAKVAGTAAFMRS